jgi:hypothetical protein
VFVETIDLPRQEWERWHERLRYSSDPPEALIATIVWDSGDGQVTGVNLWDTPEAIADFMWTESGRSSRWRASQPTSRSDTANRSRSICVNSPARQSTQICRSVRGLVTAGQ